MKKIIGQPKKTGINVLLDKFVSDSKNSEQCSGYNFIVKK